MTDKMREVPSITDETYKALMVALGMPNNRSLLSALQQIANHATQRAAWQAEQSVPVVGEVVAYGVPNSRPNESSPLMQVMLQIPPDAQYPGLLVPLIVQPTTSITEAELERLWKCEKDAERLQKDAERMQKALSDIAEWTERYTTPGHPISNIARAAIAAEGEGE